MTNFRNSSHSVQLHLDVDYGAKYGSENIRNMYFEAFRPVDSEFDVGKSLGHGMYGFQTLDDQQSTYCY